ncbi:MAG TPA: hypothetical protein VKA27_04690 [Sunxiuqinia sp.]|nr:hypothetical protein [Sunxiuqinia sp.]
MKAQINEIEHELLDILYHDGIPEIKSLQRVLKTKSADGQERLHKFKGSEILYAKKNLAKMGLINVIEAQRRHDLEEGEGFTRVGDDITFYYFDLDKKLEITEKGIQWCQAHLMK